MNTLADKMGFGPHREVVHPTEPGGLYIIKVTPPAFISSKKLPTLEVRLTQNQYLGFLAWQQNKCLIEEALPDLSPSEREVIMTGLGDDDFHDACMEEDDDEEED